MDYDFLHKLPQQGRGEFLKAGVLAYYFHKLFSVCRGFQRLGKLALQGGGFLFQFLLLGFVVCRKFRKTSSMASGSPLVARTMVSYGTSLGFLMEKHLHFFMQHLQGTVYVMPRRTPAASVQFPDFLLCVTPEKIKVNDFPLFLWQRGQGFGKISICEDNPLTAYRNRVLLVR